MLTLQFRKNGFKYSSWIPIAKKFKSASWSEFTTILSWGAVQLGLSSGDGFRSSSSSPPPPLPSTTVRRNPGGRTPPWVLNHQNTSAMFRAALTSLFQIVRQYLHCLTAYRAGPLRPFLASYSPRTGQRSLHTPSDITHPSHPHRSTTIKTHLCLIASSSARFSSALFFFSSSDPLPFSRRSEHFEHTRLVRYSSTQTIST